MEALIVILVVVGLVIAAVYLLPRLGRSGGGRTETEPASLSPRPAPGRPDDPDQTDEAAQVVSAIGGQVRPGDAVTVHIADPAVWGLSSFDLDLSIGAVSRAEIRDQSGIFSFLIYWMPPRQEAAILTAEGDALALAEAFVGRLVLSDGLRDALLWCRDRYLEDQTANELDYDLSEHGLGTWTAFAARQGGTLRLELGATELLPGGAAAGDGLPYRDFTLYQGNRDQPARLRLVEVGGYAYVFQGEVMLLRDAQFLRRAPGK